MALPPSSNCALFRVDAARLRLGQAFRTAPVSRQTDPNPGPVAGRDLLPPSPLRTVCEGFPSHGSSLSNACLTRGGNETNNKATVDLPITLREEEKVLTRAEWSDPSQRRNEHEGDARCTTPTRDRKGAHPSGSSRVSGWAHARAKKRTERGTRPGSHNASTAPSLTVTRPSTAAGNYVRMK